MRKLFISFISVLMVMLSLSFTSFADGQTKITVGSAITSPDSEVSVPINISNNQGLWGTVFNVYFDTEVFEVEEVVNNGDVFKSADILIGPSDFANGYVRVVVTPSNVTSNNTNNGTICTLKLDVDEDAALRDYQFRLEVEDVCDIDGKDLEVSSVNGSVSVKKTADNVAEKNTKKNSNEEVIARAEDNKIIEEETINSGDSNRRDNADNNSEETTASADEANEAETTAEGVTEADSDNKVSADVEESEEDNSFEHIKDSSSIRTSPWTIVLIICGAVVLAGIIVLVVVIVKKKKK